MSKPNLLEIVQEILSDMTSDVVNSIDDTDEAGQVAAALRAAALYCKRDSAILLSLADELEVNS